MGENIDILKQIIYFKWRLNLSNKEELEHFQRVMINEQLNYIVNNSKYYGYLKKKNNLFLEDFPIINKKIMMDNFDEMNTVGMLKDEAFKLAVEAENKRGFDEKINGITVGLSSGTSGHRGIFLASDKERTLWAGAVIAKLLPLKLLINCKVAFFMRANSNLYETVKSTFIQFKFYDMYFNIEEHIKSLNQFKPIILIGPPSILLELSEAKRNGKLNINPKKIISVAEVLEEKDKKIIGNSFNNIVHEVYQCTEGFLGVTCKCGNLHINEDAVFIEKEWIDKKRFIPIITDFQRKSQPIIRYRLNDILISSKEVCPCGSPFLRIEAIEGREDDIFIFKGKKEGEYKKIYADFIRRCFLFTESIIDYRVIQVDINHIEIMLDNKNEEIKEALLKEFKKLSEHMDFVLPNIIFYKYEIDKKRKLKRVERLNFKY